MFGLLMYLIWFSLSAALIAGAIALPIFMNVIWVTLSVPMAMIGVIGFVIGVTALMFSMLGFNPQDFRGTIPDYRDPEQHA